MPRADMRPQRIVSGLTGHPGPVERMKIGARERHELAVCWVVHRLPPDNPGTKCGAVLLDIVSKIGLRRMRAGHKHFGDARERVADLAEEFMLSAHAAIML